MSDLPFVVADAALRLRLREHLDAEGKIPRTLEALGPLGGRDIVLFDADGGWRARQLASLGARVLGLGIGDHLEILRRELAAEVAAGTVSIAVGTPLDSGLPDGSVDAAVSFWTGFRGGTEAELAEAERILRPEGRLLVVHEYARDDLSRLRPENHLIEAVAWSRRDGWFLSHGFKIRVIHAFWTFPELETMREVAAAVFGATSPSILADLRRPRLSWKVAVYHRARSPTVPGSA